MTSFRNLIFIAFSACLVCACSDDDKQSQRPITPATVLVDGSSTVYPITREAARRFERTRRDAHVEVKFSGTTAGFRAFCSGQLDISNASREITTNERAECESNGVEFIQLPLAMDALSVVVHPRNHWANDITVDELKRLWEKQAEGKIKSWRDLRETWPDEPIVLFGRGQDSGTYDYFTTVILGTTRSSRSDYNASEDEEWLAAGIAKERNALGFFGIGAYHRHWDELKLLPIDSGAGAIYPSLDTVADGSYTPLSRPLFLYVNQQSLVDKPDLKAFLDHYFSGLNTWLHFTGYMPIASETYAQNLQQL